MAGVDPNEAKLDLSGLLSVYKNVQDRVMKLIASLSSGMSSSVQVGKFLQAEMMMGQLGAVGDTLSNIISIANNMVMAAARNQKAQ